MDHFIRLAELGAPDSNVGVAATVSLVGLLIMRLTNPRWARERRKTRTLDHLLREAEKIESKDGELTAKDAETMELLHTAIKGDFGVDENEDETPESRPWWTRWMWWRG